MHPDSSSPRTLLGAATCSQQSGSPLQQRGSHARGLRLSHEVPHLLRTSQGGQGIRVARGTGSRMAGLRATVGTPHLALHGKTICRSVTETRRRKAKRTVFRPVAPARCTCSRLPAPPRPLPDPHAEPAPSPSPLSEAAAASPRPLRLPDTAGQHPEGRRGVRSDQPCRLRRGPEGRQCSSIGATLTRTPPPAATSTAATG